MVYNLKVLKKLKIVVLTISDQNSCGLSHMVDVDTTNELNNIFYLVV